MEQNSEDIDYKLELKKALSIIETQSAIILQLQSKLQQQEQINQDLQFQLAQLKKLVFGSRHEKFVGADAQMAPTLFDIPAIPELLETTTVSYQKTGIQARPNHPGRNSFPENLRREETVINPVGINFDLVKRIGESVTETLAYVPAELFVKKVIRPKYLDAATNNIYQALAPERSFERSNVDPSLVAQIIVEKMVDHIPLDRQIKRYARLGYPISDSTIGNWVAASAAYLIPVYQAHKQLVLASGYLHADETIIKVLDSDKKNATHQGYYWVYQCNANKLVLFDYRTGRGREGPQSILKDYKGYLQTDGYIVYEDFDKNPDIIVFNCMAHARRKFSEALPNDKLRAEHVLAEIQKLYAIERHLTDNNLIGNDKLQYRKEQALPILKELGVWMQKAYPEVLPSSAIGKAIFYSLSRWDKLSLYATTDFLHLDNNPVENSIRPVAIGRKNYLFAGSHAAAQRSAIFYSLLATCKNYQINPVDWMQDVLTRIAGYPINKIQELLPQNWKPTQNK